MSYFHQIVNQISEPKSHYELDMPEGWGQGRATFGGIVAGILYKAMAVNVEKDRLVRAMNVSFVGPITPGNMSIEVTTFREGGSVSQLEAKAIQNGEVQCVALASFGKDRASSIEIPAALAESPTVSVDEAKELAYIPDITPEFVQFFRMRWAKGGFPFSGSNDTGITGYMKFKDQKEHLAGLPFDETVLITLIDTWPPVQLSLLKKPAPASSLTWSMEFIQPLSEQGLLHEESWLHYQVDIDTTHNGYGQTHANIWSEDGRLLAISRQTVTVYD